ncbi:MAG: HAD-IIIA family hydrolase [Planctomycetes bacterium]|nr:HAD-IIIA family hydrolase [Planctomycetota bacterium]
MTATRRTAFLDRDGTLNREQSFVTRPAELEVLPGAVDALRALAAADVAIVVVTNQSGIARGLYSERDLAAIHRELHERLERLPLAYLHCPHHPDLAGPWGGGCPCRKPQPGLLHAARALLGVDFEGGLLAGDSARDLLAGRGLPLRSAYVRTGKDPETELAKLAAAGMTPDCDAPDLQAAVEWYLGA